MLIKVKVFSESRKEKIIKKSPDSFEVCVKEKPRGGAANLAVCAVLADYFKLDISKVRLIRGGQTRNKIFNIETS